MNRWKKVVWMAVGIGVMAIVAGGLMTVPSVAQTVRAALVRDVDNGALDPVRISIFGNLQQNETFKFFNSITVPAGKRLVIENASVWTFTSGNDRISAVWLKPTSLDHYTLLDPAESEFRASGNSTIAAYNRPVKLYFNAGEQLQTQVYADGVQSSKLANVYLTGYYVTLP